MSVYNSTHTGEQIDNFDSRLTTLENAITVFTNTLNNYLTTTSFNTTINNLNSVMNTIATKEQVNSISMAPSNSYTSITRLFSSKVTAWTDFMSAYTAPTNGYLDVYFVGSSDKPSFQVNLTGGMQYRGNGNGGRNIGALIPVRKGQVINGSCIYCYPEWIRFYGVATI